MGKIAAILAKKEAETYQSQGLHREAVALYNDLLNSESNMDPAIKKAIQSQIQGIHKEMQSSDHKRRPLTAKEITTIRDGWGDKASETDILVCAQAFSQIGAGSEALKELRSLFQKKEKVKRIYLSAAADCFVNLFKPRDLPIALDKFAQEISKTQKTIWAFQLTIADQMKIKHHIDHATAIYRHLQKIPEIAQTVSSRLDKPASGINPT